MPYMIFQYGLEPVLIQHILIGFEAILENLIPGKVLYLVLHYLLLADTSYKKIFKSGLKFYLSIFNKITHKRYEHIVKFENNI